MVSIQSGATAYTGKTAEQSAALDKQAYQKLTELGGSLDAGKLTLPSNVQYAFQGDSFVLGGSSFPKEMFDKYVTSLSGGQRAGGENQQLQQLVDTAQYAGGISPRANDIIHKLFPDNDTRTRTLDPQKLSPVEQEYLTQALNKVGPEGLGPESDGRGWSVQKLRDAFVSLEHPDLKYSTFPGFTPEKHGASFTTIEANQSFQAMNQEVAAKASAEERRTAVRDSLTGVEPTGAITRERFVDYLQGKNVSPEDIEKTFLPVFDRQLDTYRANRQAYYARMGGTDAFVVKEAYANDLARNQTLLDRWPV